MGDYIKQQYKSLDEHNRMFCWCGMLKPCKHGDKDKPVKTKQHHYNGYSKHQASIDGWQRSEKKN